MERRGRSWLLDVHANCVAVVTPDDQTLRRAVGRRSHPRRLVFISKPSIVILPTKWLILVANLHILFTFIFFWLSYYFTDLCFPWIPFVLKIKKSIWFHIVLLPIYEKRVIHYFIHNIITNISFLLFILIVSSLFNTVIKNKNDKVL